MVINGCKNCAGDVYYYQPDIPLCDIPLILNLTCEHGHIEQYEFPRQLIKLQ